MSYGGIQKKSRTHSLDHVYQSFKNPLVFPQNVYARVHTPTTPSPKPECHHLSTYSTEILEPSLSGRFGTRPSVAPPVPEDSLLQWVSMRRGGQAWSPGKQAPV